MSAKVTIWAWSQKVPNSTTRLVLLGMADICRDSGIVWASQQTIADKIQMSLRTVRDAVNTLAELGLISVTPRPGRTEMIRFNLTPVVLFPDGPEPDDFDEVTPAAPAATPANGSITPAAPAGEPIYNLEDKPKTAPEREGLLFEQEGSSGRKEKIPKEAFETFWRKYPRKDSLGGARRVFGRAWAKLHGNAEDRLETLLEAIDRQALAARDRKYVPYAATWLNDERWLDEAPSAGGGAAALADWT